MDKPKNETPMDNIEQDFKDKVFEIFSEKNPEVHRDNEGYIVIPVKKNRRKMD